MRFQDLIEAEAIASVLIVRMIAVSKIAKYPVYCFRVRIRADFENFVIVVNVDAPIVLLSIGAPRQKSATALSHTLIF
jgi:hypothetical protein